MSHKALWLTVLGLLIAAFIPLAGVGAQFQADSSAQQQDTIAISPTNGPPGTVVTLSIIAGKGWDMCYAGDISLGPVRRATTVTVPSSWEVGRQVKVYCSSDSSSGLIFSNIVWFTITAPPVADSDSDGVPDSQDQCPNQYGPAQYQGCPDSDGDGVPDNIDACPNEYGPANNSGCPAAVVDSDGDGVPDLQDACPNEYGTVENGGCPAAFTVPTDGPCAIAPYGQQAVNVRSTPAIEENNVVGTLYPAQLYYVVGKTTRPDGLWWQIANGWVSGSAVQYGGYNCGSIPDTGPVVPADSDGDGLADPQDACPYEFGPVENGGCPVPADTDGDGLADPQDACPYEVGPLSNNGCPVPADTDNDGLADPQDACPFEAGPLTNNGCPEVGVTARPAQVDLTPALAACPQLLPDAQALPVHVQLYLAYGSPPEDTCNYLQGLLEDLVFGDTGPALSDENTQAIMDQCPELLPALIGMMDRLRGINSRAWQILDSVMTPENACQLAQAIVEGRIPPEFGSVLMGTSSLPLVSLRPVNHTPLPTSAFALASDDLIDTAIALCIAAPISLDRAVVIRERIKAAGIQDTQLFATPCPIVNLFANGGDLSSAQQIFFDLLQTECGMDNLNAYLVTELANAFGVDWIALLSMDPATICADLNAAVLGNLKDPTTDPNVSPAMATCPMLAYHLHGYEAELSLYELWVILSSADPCGLADKFVHLGALEFTDQTYPLPACFDTGANTVTLTGGFVLTGDAPWSTKLAVLSRDPATICGDIMLTVPPDTDEDGIDDTADLCPGEFALTLNGCPGGIAPNTPPEIAPIPDQAFMQGTSIDIAVTATDADSDPLVVTAVSGDPGVVGVALAGNILTATGVSVGATTVTVSADDGTDITDFTFSVIVNAPAPNTPPVIAPIPDQTVNAGMSINVIAAVSDADGDPLTVTAASANPAVGMVSVTGTTLTLSGINAGSTLITVIVADGSAASSTTFHLDVFFAAPPVATTEPPPPPPTAPTGPAAIDTAPSQALVQQAAAAGLTEELDQYGLLELPGEFATAPSAAFQASLGEGQPSNVFVIVDGEIVEPLDPATESRAFPSLDPSGELLAFLSTDAAGNVTLRVLNVPRNVSLPVLSASPSWTIGLYPLAWAPDGESLLVTLMDAAGVPSIYQVELNPPTPTDPVLMVTNATTATFAPNGNYIAFEQPDPQGNSSIYVAAMANLGSAHPITSQPAGASCYTPMFGADSISLFFVCRVNNQTILYRYGIQGLAALDVGVTGVANPVPGPGEGFIGFDDGAVIYYGYDDGSRVVPLLRLQGQSANHMRWPALADPGEQP